MRERVARRVVGAARAAKRPLPALVSPRPRGGLYGKPCDLDAVSRLPDAVHDTDHAVSSHASVRARPGAARWETLAGLLPGSQPGFCDHATSQL